MSASELGLVIILLSIASYFYGRRRAIVAGDRSQVRLHSVPSYYGFYIAIWCGVPALILLLGWLALDDLIIRGLVLAALPDTIVEGKTDAEIDLLIATIRNAAVGIVFGEPPPEIMAAAEHLNRLKELSRLAMTVVLLACAIAGIAYARGRIAPGFWARNRVENSLKIFLIFCSVIAIMTTIGIVASLFFEAMRFFSRVPVTEFLFGLTWSPQTAIREDQVGSSGAFGAVPVFAGTLLISSIALLVAVPIGLLTAIYLSEYAPGRVRATVKPIVEVLAGIPTVVYGFFAVLTVAPVLRAWGADIGLDISANSALAAGSVMGLMIIPFVSSLSDDVINAVPQSLRDGSAAVGATKAETIRQVIIPAALPGIVGGVLLAASRAIGETMIVVMAAGLLGNLTANPLEGVTTVTVQIVTLLIGDTAFDSSKTLAAFALGFMLFFMTLCLNVVALRIVQKYREKYD